MQREDVLFTIGSALTFGPGVLQVFTVNPTLLRLCIFAVSLGALSFTEGWRARYRRERDT